MKEINLRNDSKLVFRETFNDEVTTRINGGIPTAIVYRNGVGQFSATNGSKLVEKINLNGTYSIRMKLISITYTLNGLLVDFRNTIGTGTGYIIFSSPTTIAPSNGINNVYINGILTPNINFLSSDIVVTGLSIKSVQTYVSSRYSSTNNVTANWELFEVYKGNLTVSEIKNLYTGRTYKALPYKSTTLFHLNSDNGVIRDLTGKTTPVTTSVQLPKIGSNINVMKFNGSSGNINIGSQALVGDITFMGVVNNLTKGENNAGTLLHNGQVEIRCNSVNQILLSRNNGTTYSFTPINTIKLCNNQFICITSTSAGITNIYIGDKNNPPVLSGSANQNAGTPVAGSTCYIGNRAADDRTLNGWLNDVRVEQSILTLEEITQIWSNTKIKY